MRRSLDGEERAPPPQCGGDDMHDGRPNGSSVGRAAVIPSRVPKALVCHSERSPRAAQAEARNRTRPDRGLSLYREDCDSSPPGLRPSARNDKARRFLASGPTALRSE